LAGEVGYFLFTEVWMMLQRGEKSMRIYKIKKILALIILEFFLIININFVIESLSSFYDFGSFYSSGRLANDAKNPYSIQFPLVFEVSFSPNGPSAIAPNLNPPILVLLFQFLAKFNAYLSLMGWRIFSLILIFLTIFIVAKRKHENGINGLIQVLWVASMAGLWHTIQLGQVYAMIFFFTSLSWVFMIDNRKALAGIALGIAIALKPNLVIWGLFLIVNKQWRIILYAFLSGLLLTLIPVFVYGFDIYFQWLDCIKTYTGPLLDFPANNTFQGLLVRLGNSTAGIYIGVIFLIVLLLIILFKKPDINKINSLGISTSLLLSPVAWSGYTLLLVPAFFFIKSWNKVLITSAFILAIPFVFVVNLFLINSFFNIIFGWLYGWGILLLVLWYTWSCISPSKSIFSPNLHQTI
jgi:hypothetical protein